MCALRAQAACFYSVLLVSYALVICFERKADDVAYRIGIDAGSKTIKVIVLDAEGEPVFSLYRRHRSDIVRTLSELLHDLIWRLGDLEATVAITGSAGMQLAEEVEAPFIQEVVATTHVVKALFPEADAVIELGGEDAKVIYLTGGLEQRMNATCAGGTGGFIDTIAFMLGVSSSDMSKLANGARQIYPIASRCAVFAQTDVRPLLNAGASKADIAASALDAVVRQTLGGLSCGRPIRGTVVFLGGPLQHMPYLVHRFRRALGLNARTGIKPRYAHMFTARGVALLSERECGEPRPISELAERIANIHALEDDLEHLPPLFENVEDVEAFRARHAALTFPRKRLFDVTGNLYVGIDAGSTTVKLAVLDEDRNLVHTAYEPTRGDMLKTLRDMLLELYASMPRPYNRHEEPYVRIAHVTATGYGEELLRAAIGVDSGVVETAAHLRAAQHICPDVSFVLDIGGQDMKALWVRDGQVSDAVLNEACSSGCGSFIEGTSYSLRSDPWRFAEGALRAKNPVDLGTKCTVFMTSRVRHAQKVGASIDDIAAGVAYSVVKNALYRIIGVDRIAAMGDAVVVQGGTFKSDAVLRAFELACGKEVKRYEQAHLMGAIGAALIAAERAQAASQAASTLLGRDELADLAVKRRALTCTGCANACMLSVVEFGAQRAFVTGNRCERGTDELARQGLAQHVARTCNEKAPKPPDVIAVEQQLLRSFSDLEQGGARGSVRIGIMNTLETYAHTPFWHALLSALGFSVAVPSTGCEQTAESAAWESVPSESVCYAAKISHARYFNLKAKGACAVLMPRLERSSHCPVSCSYASALADNLSSDMPPLVSPLLASGKPERIAADDASRAALLRALSPLADQAQAPLCASELDRAIAAGLQAQYAFQDSMRRAGQHALQWLQEDHTRHAILVAGRPYHHDAALLHGINEQLQRLGFAVLSVAGISDELRALRRVMRETRTPDADERAWRPAKRLVAAARWTAENEQVDLVCLQSFGCGFDAVSVEQAHEVLDCASRPYTMLKVDGISDVAHIRIRLRTLAEAIESRKRAKATDANRMRTSDGNGSGTGASANVSLSGACATLLDRGLCAADLDVARRDVIKDMCFTASAMAARAIALVRDNPHIETVHLPRICKNCLVDAVPLAVERATGKTPAFVWEDVWPDERELEHKRKPETLGIGASQTPAASGAPDVPSASQASTAPEEAIAPCASPVCAELATSQAPTTQATPQVPALPGAPQAPTTPGVPERPRIGILGNALLCFDPYMNDHLTDLLEHLGCEPVLPDPALLATEDVRYLPQLEAFKRAGVRDVIYLLSFGCLKGHVSARGALHELRERFNTMNITVIDFDPEASALNRENRVRLAVEAAREHAAKTTPEHARAAKPA